MASKRRLRRQAERKDKRDAFYRNSNRCFTKQAFYSREDAEYNMERLKASVFYDGRELNVYVCPLSQEDSPHYHFGHVRYRDVYVEEEGQEQTA